MQSVDFKQVKILDGFFGRLQELNECVSVYNVYKRFKETGRFAALKCVRDDAHKPHIFGIRMLRNGWRVRHTFWRRNRIKN